MSPRYIEALGEVNYVISGLDVEDRIRIPEKFMNFIESNKSRIAKKIDVENLSEEAYAILAFVYRKFLANSEESEKLELEYQERLKAEKEVVKNNITSYKGIEYKPKVIGQNDSPKEVNQLIHYEQQKWYEKLFSQIKGMFKKR